MTQPTPYDRQFNFQNQQALTPTDPNPGDELDSEFNAIKLTLDQILSNIALIQRDDGALANDSVARVTLSADVPLGFGAPSIWQPNTRYVADFDTIFREAFFYTCNTTHVSDPSPLGFDNDIDNWTLIADFSAAAIEGLGTMSTQNANNVVISGGTISGTVITVADPDAATKAANKQYVDDEITTLTAYVDAQVTTLHGELWAPSSTRVVFQQTSAPTGWTKDATLNDRALRIVSGTVGSGGSVPVSTVFGKQVTDNFTLTLTETPSHNHGGTTAAGGVDHNHSEVAMAQTGPAAPGTGTATWAPFGQLTGGATAFSHQHGISSQGSGGAHQHGMDIRVLYADSIVAQKD